MKVVLVLLCLAAVVAMGWLAAMEAALRHAGFAHRAGLDILLASPAAITLWAVARGARWLSATAVLASAAAAAYGALVFWRNDRAAHFEGFVALAALALIAQGILAILVLGGGLATSGPRQVRRT